MAKREWIYPGTSSQGDLGPSSLGDVLHPAAPTARYLRALYGSEEAVRLAEEFRQRVNASIGAFIDPNTGEIVQGVLPASQAWSLLEQCHNILAERAMELAARRGSAEWLWFLRRLRGQFHINEWTTTDGYVQALAEVLATGHSRPSVPVVGDRFSYPLDTATLLDLFWIREVAIVLYQLHSTMKRCAKGQSVEFVPGSFPQHVPDRDLDEAIKRHDERVQRAEGNLFQAVGLDPGAEATPDMVLSEATRLGGIVPLWQPTATPHTDYLVPTEDPPPILPQMIDLDRIPPLREQAVLTEEHVALIALLWACFNIGTRDEGRVARRFSPALQWGYMVTPYESFLLKALDEIAQWLQAAHGQALDGSVLPTDSSAILGTLTSLRPSTWPPIPGNPVHSADKWAVVDLVGASQRLTTTLLRPRDGADVNVWSEHFERDVQRIIDASPWAPSQWLRPAIGRTVRRRDGSPITNLDAIAERNGRLLLVSCKSIALTVPALGGRHETVREIKEKAEAAAGEWQRVLHTIRDDADPRSLPLHGATNIDGCVILPGVPFYTETKWDRDVLPGLPFLASSSELRQAVAPGRDEAGDNPEAG